MFSWTILFFVVCHVIFTYSVPIVKHPNDLIPKAPHCGATFADKIFGGSETDLGEYPWLALLMYDIDNEISHKCGGSLINNRYVLTAAHCLINELVSVRLGEHNTTSPEDCTTENNLTYCNAPPQDIPVESVTFYGKYKEEEKFHDIALIRLSREAQIEDSVKPICLPNYKTPEPAVGTNLVVAGWGYTEHGKQSNVLLQVRVPLVSDSVCSAVFLGLNYDGQLCAGGVENEDSCSGDSGGPLMEQVKGFWYARGIVSHGKGCGRKGTPAVYTRTSHYLNWIHDNVLP